MLSNRLAGKVAVVTGIASGIGRGTALVMARHGAKVVGCDLNAAGAEATVKAAAAEGLDLRSLHPVDLTEAGGAERVMAFAAEAHGGIDILVNAAAVVAMAWIEDMDYATEWRKTMVGELDIVFLGCQAAWPHLKARGGGAIVNFASANAHVALKALPALAHTATKGGVLAMTRQLAMEGAPHNIRANTISPGLILTAETERALRGAPGTRSGGPRQAHAVAPRQARGHCLCGRLSRVGRGRVGDGRRPLGGWRRDRLVSPAGVQRWAVCQSGAT